MRLSSRPAVISSPQTPQELALQKLAELQPKFVQFLPTIIDENIPTSVKMVECFLKGFGCHAQAVSVMYDGKQDWMQVDCNLLLENCSSFLYMSFAIQNDLTVWSRDVIAGAPWVPINP